MEFMKHFNGRKIVFPCFFVSFELVCFRLSSFGLIKIVSTGIEYSRVYLLLYLPIVFHSNIYIYFIQIFAAAQINDVN